MRSASASDAQGAETLLLSQPLLEKSERDAAPPPCHAMAPSDASGSRAAVLLALVGLIWGTVVQSEASQALQSKGHFNKPFFITCFNHTLVAVLIPLIALRHNLCRRQEPASEGGGRWLGLAETVRHYSVLPVDQLVRVAVFASVASLVADYFWYAALTGVSVTAANAIGNCSPLFVYCFSICFLREPLTLRKIGGVLLAFVGVTFVVLYQEDAAAAELLGLAPRHRDGEGEGAHGSIAAGILVVISSVFYAAFQVALKYLVGDGLTDTTTVVLLTALSGVFTVPLWVVGSVSVAHNPFAALREPFGWPETGEALALLVLSGSLAIIVNVSMPLLLCWTTPLETSVGAMLVVPLAGVWDVVFHGTRFSAECIFGSVLVLVGFGVLEYTYEKASEGMESNKMSNPNDSDRKPSPTILVSGVESDGASTDEASSADHSVASPLLLPPKRDWRASTPSQNA